MADKDVVVVGDIVCDDWRFVARKSRNPENALLCVGGTTRVINPGGAGLTAVFLSQLGANVTLFSRVDNSPHARQILDCLREWNIDVTNVCKLKRWTMPVKTRYVNDETILLRHDAEEMPGHCSAGRLDINAFEQAVSRAQCVVVSDYNKGYLRAKRSHLSRVVKQHNVPMFVDCKAAQISKYDAVTGYKINADAALKFGRCLGLDAQIESEKDPCAFVYNQMRPNFVIMTTGEDGADYHIDGKTYSAPVVDLQKGLNTVGAGDAFMAGAVRWMLLHQLTQDNSLNILHDIVLAGHIAAATHIDKDGERLSYDKLLADFCRIKFAVKPHGKIVSNLIFHLFARSSGVAGKTVVFTNGCFDVLHAGHLHLLHEAKKQGNILVVAVDSDDNARRLKGPSRPVQDAQTRAKILAAMDIVDAVTIFDDTADNAQLRQLITNCQPHYLVKGGDYKPEECVGWEEMTQRQNPGNVVCCSLFPGISTTKIIKKMREQHV